MAKKETLEEAQGQRDELAVRVAQLEKALGEKETELAERQAYVEALGEKDENERVRLVMTLYSSSENARLKDEIGRRKATEASLREAAERNGNVFRLVESIKLDHIEAEVHEEDKKGAEGERLATEALLEDARRKGRDAGTIGRLEQERNQKRVNENSADNKRLRVLGNATIKTRQLFNTRRADPDLVERAKRRAAGEADAG